MVVYHGSSHNFRTLRIRKDLTKDSSLKNEGYGVYFSLNRDVAASYGKYLYTIQVNDKLLVDMRRLDMCRYYVRHLSGDIQKQFGFYLDAYVNTRMLVEYLQAGQVAISGVGEEVKNLLDSEESFYNRFRSRTETIFRWLERWSGCPKAYLFTYHIVNCGVIKDVSSDVAVLVNKERIC